MGATCATEFGNGRTRPTRVEKKRVNVRGISRDHSQSVLTLDVDHLHTPYVRDKASQPFGFGRVDMGDHLNRRGIGRGNMRGDAVSCDLGSK